MLFKVSVYEIQYVYVESGVFDIYLRSTMVPIEIISMHHQIGLYLCRLSADNLRKFMGYEKQKSPPNNIVSGGDSLKL